MQKTVAFTLNGKKVSVEMEQSKTLLWVLRTHFELTGTKYGCGEGYCGACTVLIDNSAVRSCATTIGEVAGKSVVTIEGLADGDKLHPVQQAFVDHDALQCGYCTPGMIMNAVGLLNDISNPSREDIISGMEDNLCRCGAHNRILDAIEDAASAMKSSGN
ncbi:(2Fe-2S)-binding protein [Maribellus sediminis]|uniref:(2Fe-2S)-binding protein n=1 Tax=Maribellus sediminis TaxID=2696285 RepID=UPI001431E698|nr:(2Fe-2S)-binding protein [Maribellus sediminis]